jgi:hypothetical protein
MNWQPTCELPEPNVPVLAYVTNAYSGNRSMVIRAQHAPAKTLEQSSDCEGGDYDEESGTYWCVEGWYETNCFDEINWKVDGEVTHWMPLPEKPE